MIHTFLTNFNAYFKSSIACNNLWPDGIWDSSKNYCPHTFLPVHAVVIVAVAVPWLHTKTPPLQLFPLRPLLGLPTRLQHLLQQVKLHTSLGLVLRDGEVIEEVVVTDVRRSTVTVLIHHPLVSRRVCVSRTHVLRLKMFRLTVDVVPIHCVVVVVRFSWNAKVNMEGFLKVAE